MSEPSFRRFLDVSLDTLQRECPRAYAAMGTGLLDRRVAIRVDAESFGIEFDRRQVRSIDDTSGSVVHVATTRATILDVMAAKLTLLAAVVADRFELRGRPEDLLRFHDALIAYIAGAVRSPSFPGLLAAYTKNPTGYESRESRPTLV